MKNINTNPSFFSFDKGFFLVLLAIVSSLSVYGSTTDCIKSIRFKVLLQESRAISTDTDPNTLTTKDFLQAKTNTSTKEVELCIDQNNEITITTIYENDLEGNKFYHSPIAKSIVSSQGVLIYDAAGQLIDSPELAPSDDPISYTVDQDQLASYGLKPLLSAFTPGQMQDLTNMGLQAWEQDGIYYMMNNDKDVILDPTQNQMSYKFYEEGLLLSSKTEQFYDLGNGYNIPSQVIEKRYGPLSTADIMEFTTTTTYLQYQVIENGNTIVDYTNPNDPLNGIQSRGKALSFDSYTPETRPEPVFTLYPNPASDRVMLDLSVIDFLEEISFSIIDVSGQEMATHQIRSRQGLAQFDIAQLPKGIYFLQSNHPQWTINKKFVKN